MFLKRFRINLFSKIFLYSVGVVTATVFINLLFNLFFLDRFYLQRKERTILELANNIEKYIENGNHDRIAELIHHAREFDGVEVKIVPNSSRSMMMHGGVPMGVFSEKDEKKFRTVQAMGIGATILTYSRTLPGNYRTFFTSSLSVMAAHTHEVYVFNFLTGIFSLIVSGIIGIWFSRKITKDIGKLNKMAEEIALLNFSEKIVINRNDELGDLGKNIEKMSEKLSSSIENIKSFVSNASHELKTPISVLCTYSQALIKNQVPEEDKGRYYGILLKEGLEMKELCENLLTISKLDSPGMVLEREEIELQSLFKGALEKYDFIELEKDIQIDILVPETIINGDLSLMKLAINNIINNALKYSPEMGEIKILKKDKKISISNSIDGKLSEQDLNNLWEPFTRGNNAEEKSKDGSGLGLSIIKKALTLNGIESEISLEDGNFTFKIYLEESYENVRQV